MTNLISRNLIKRLPIFLLLVTLFSVTSKAQDYKPVEWDILRLGAIIPSENTTSGVSISTEPRFNISNKFSAGLRLGVDVYGSSPIENVVDIGVSTSLYLLGDYYFSNKGNKRAFAGLGLGTHAGLEVTATIDEDGEIIEEETRDFGTYYGITPRIGYEFGILRISGEYNFTLDKAVPDVLGIHLGLTIGGRKRK